MNNLSDNLKKIRKDNSLSQEQLADVLGVSRQAISKWESGAAYPEMEKLVQICQRFDVNIDDLLNKDIREIKSEEESKKSINKYIDDFLNFISDTVNLFSKMNFKSKLKCLFEQFILIIILFIVFAFIGSVFYEIVKSILSIFGSNFSYRVTDLLMGIYIILVFIISAVILIHVFKTRYLDYFLEVNKNTEVNNDSNDDKENKDNDKSIMKNTKIELRKDKDRIIIRDPKHSEYKFINGFFKLIILFIKFFALLFALSLCVFLVGLLAAFIISFLFIKTGFLFMGLILGLLSLSIGTVVVILLLFNFIFNRKNDKKKMIISFISSIIIFGVSCGLIFIGSLSFNVKDFDDKSLVVSKTMEMDMEDNLILPKNSEITYIEKDINNVLIEYEINKFFTLNYSNHYGYYDDYVIYLYAQCSNPFDALRYVIKEINNHTIINMNSNFYNVKIYANHDNLTKLNNNRIKYEEELKNRDANYDYYEETIASKDETIEEKDELISELYEEIDEKNVSISDYQEKLEANKQEIRDLKNQINEFDCD